MENERWDVLLDLAINEAWKYQFLTYPNPAVGASLVIKNKVFVSAHKKAGSPHAEVNVLWDAFSFFHKTPKFTDSFEIHEYLIKHHNNFFNEAEMFVTLEPCSHIGKTPSCANLLKVLKPKSVTIGIKDPIKSHSGGVEILKNAGIEVNLLNDKRCFDLIEPFIKWSKDKFIFFKLAQSFNGAITGGYISSEDSLNWVHKVRDKIDLLVIGGNTVRIDRPTLDARRVNGKAPDILIYSKNKNFDKNIPLFKVKNRKVFIEDSLEEINDYKFIMIEGGENLYKKLKDFVDWKVFIVTPKIFDRINYKLEDSFKILHVEKRDDLIVFGK
ncbi:bifunctional diaminohydroxyphosphoribosylaminopyrimidine deaminase/5-amino-6-(5-phosphoribosylamino)uracil reductase RibD [Caminibacter mediatlanticus TB-2]|uniref:Riboflavin biosynthesis protein RibD n=1 Tax=Caminibacter mediatlanticus TB-2 TaxID=391592 RepID=A0AAI9AI30_9BACT|nr:bifunctional diaminohydroxyphosphoribosylaminopyrimidine deaminase/5-amino-6-(5-phosphoribosylamino)uracil reductase RibD [Caminibacter mediatlanticus]EDM24611.1 Riboflavin biosynthesis protein RibD [Caminibacter mediatlanticus TB-2]QCT95254.1 bifunctional diaminohydroxyphosphoribosylaminopyrimidine deaminase/5-amino-6-(5-phosphoribosylamino)uracil reductase RibD [Caminibacter mediatlanticus TB-2]